VASVSSATVASGDVAAFGGDHRVVDLDEERADEPDDRGAVGEVADDVGAALEFATEPFDVVVRPTGLTRELALQARTASGLLWVLPSLTCGHSYGGRRFRVVREFREHPTDRTDGPRAVLRTEAPDISQLQADADLGLI
jgi:hypothetical protein